MGEKFAANPVTGTGSLTVPIATSPGRSGFGPQLALSYDSGAGNGTFGFGWNLSVPAITRKTDKGLPQYDDVHESDVFILAGAEDLVPVFRQEADGQWLMDAHGAHVIHEDEVDGYRVRRYRPRVEGLFARIERWTHLARPTDVHWRSISKDNILTVYGQDSDSRIADPKDASHIFSWLICETRDDKGNAVLYRYKPDDGEGVSLDKASERNRGTAGDASRTANRYLKRIHYGNRRPLLGPDGQRPRRLNAQDIEDQLQNHQWMFEVVFDYGEHDVDFPSPREDRTWPFKPDASSNHRPGFELRTTRLCQRVLMFHHFPDGADAIGVDYLVRSTDFEYDSDNPQSYSFLRWATQTGWRKLDTGYRRRSLPPVEFEYTKAQVQDEVQELADPESAYNLPVGLGDAAYRWTDLHGEGIPGILTEQAGAWLYERNLSPLAGSPSPSGPLPTARFAAVETVATQPNVSLAQGADFMDLSGDGQPDVVMLEGPTPGLYRHDSAEGWQAFEPLPQRLNRDLSDPNLKFLDLDGDGHADVLVTEHDALAWHPSLADAGFGPERRIAKPLDEEQGPRIVFADGTQSIFLADMCGDGLTDIVRIRNGEVCYWPNLGHGRFGAKITMDEAPWFDHPDLFDPSRLRLADIDGSGTTDLIYLHRDGVRLYFNRSGSGWSKATVLKAFPRVDDLVHITPLDLLGNGTACLVWSSPLPADAARPMRYVNLMGGQKPHLLIKTINNLGAETHVEYAPSTKFYLQDKLAGRPWITRLPFPVHVVERVRTEDRISRNRFTTRYAYHHGYFDGVEREFRGFGMVEQWDTEHIAALVGSSEPPSNIDAASHVPPVHTKTWFHTGAYFGAQRVSNFYAGLLDASDTGEYFREPGLTDTQVRELHLPDTVMPDGLTADEEREAARALKGAMLRQEVYADDAGPGATPEQRRRAATPYTVAEQNFSLRPLQPQGTNRHAVFLAHPREALTYHYERNAADPRTQHTLTLEVDDFGNVLKQAAIGYGRRDQVRVLDQDSQTWRRVPNPGLAQLPLESDRQKQTTTLVSYTEARFTNAVDSIDALRAPAPCEAVAFELTGFAATGPSGRYGHGDFIEPSTSGRLRNRLRFDDEVPYEAKPTNGRCRRPLKWSRTLYRSDDLSTLLPLGEQQRLALPGESYQLAFTPGLIQQIYKRPRAGEADENLLPDPASDLGGQGPDRGGCVQSQVARGDGRFPADEADDHWWLPSGRIYYAPEGIDEVAQARAHFYVPRQYEDPFGSRTEIDYDYHDLLMVETRDALRNRVTVDVNDYRVLQPRLISDPNRNQTEVAFDTLGLVVGTAVMGKPLPAPVEGDSLAGFEADLSEAQVESLFEPGDPRAALPELLKGATTRIVYDLHRFLHTRQAHPDDPSLWQPVGSAALARETHIHAPLPPHGLRIQVAYGYTDGFGREIQKKTQAGPGPIVPGGPIVNPRWTGGGWTIFNNKGKPVRQYEPFFSPTHRFEFGVQAGVSALLFYDPAERVVATLHPNHTYEKVVFDPWQQTTYDVNDTCAPRNTQTGDPRTDADIGGTVAEYFRTQPAAWQTWHAQRLGGALGEHEKTAAERAAAHADTPSTAHFDALGRAFLTLAHNRVICKDHDLDGTEDNFATRIELDIEGNQRAVLDERKLPVNHLPTGALEQRIVMRYAYDMLGNRIYQLSMEAGARWMLNDVADQPIRAWDSRGHNFTTTYDALRRPVQQTVRGTFSNPDPLKPNSDPRTLNRDILVDKIEYGEPAPDSTLAEEADAQRLNLRTRIFRHFDSAGVATNARLDANDTPIEAYDFKGNLLRSTRRLVSDYKGIPDWQLPGPQLEAEFFEAGTRYDALNRPVQSIAPYSSLTRPDREGKFNVTQHVFNEANLLDRIDVWLEQTTQPDSLLDASVEPPSLLVGVSNIDFDAKGQRQRIDYKNGASTTYTYDRLTFRLTRLRTTRDPNRNGLSSSLFKSNGVVQDLQYTYDPVGNISRIADDALPLVIHAGEEVQPVCTYLYDAHYRLVEATGREHIGQSAFMFDPPNGNFRDYPFVGASLAANPQELRNYTEHYVYDAVGNFTQLQHRAADGGWTRLYDYGEASLTEPAKKSNRLSSTELAGIRETERYLHDAHGSMARMPHLGGARPDPNMAWDYRDQLRQTDLGGGGTAYYVYDATGQRVRKVWEKSATLVEERIYLGGFEIYRRRQGAERLERETLHIMDDQQRIALVETRTLDTAGNDPAPPQLIRYQFGNHLGSASLELEEQAQIISYEEYTPYGSSAYQAVRSQMETPKRYRYTGMERDEETGFCYHSARYFATWLGRWISSDPSGIGDGTNTYLYSSANPVRIKDTNGRWGLDMHFTAVFFVGKLSGASSSEALRAALASQLPDDVRSMEAVSGKTVAMWRSLQANTTLEIEPRIQFLIKSDDANRKASNTHALHDNPKHTVAVLNLGIRTRDIDLFGLGLHTVGDWRPHANPEVSSNTGVHKLLPKGRTAGHSNAPTQTGKESSMLRHAQDVVSNNPGLARDTFGFFLKGWEAYQSRSIGFSVDQLKFIESLKNMKTDRDRSVAMIGYLLSNGYIDNGEYDNLLHLSGSGSASDRIQMFFDNPNAGKAVERAETIWSGQLNRGSSHIFREPNKNREVDLPIGK